MENLTCTSWLSGKHSANIEINTRLPYVAIYDFFAQGDSAEDIINEINEILNLQNAKILNIKLKCY